jgi:DNA modification methylase
MHEFSLPGAPVYVVMGAQEWPLIDQWLRARGFHWSSTIIWVKDQLVLSRKDYHTQFEPMWYGWNEKAARLQEVIDRKQSDTWFIDRPKKSEEHPTMKPLELVERAIINSSRPGAVVLDLFAGSGTTLIACERQGRVCRTMDNDPKYVAVALERWSQMTGQQPRLEG